MQAQTSHGSCLCGGVQFSVDLPTKWVAHCHCTRCQRAHGAAFVTWVGVQHSASKVDDPQQLLHWYVSEQGGSRGFCSRCGSPMFFHAPRWPGELHVARALFTEPLDREPQVHAFYDTHVSWMSLTDQLPKNPAP